MPTYIIGHKAPDLDSIAAAIGYAEFKNKLNNSQEYQAAAAEPANKLTLHILEKFGFAAPEILSSAASQKIILVDHNEFIQAVNGIEQANIMEILDHHKLDFKYDLPIEVSVKPWGSSCSLVADLFFAHNIAIGKSLAGLLLSAVLDDTVITKSPTTASKDKEIISKLSEIAGISDWQDHGMEMFKVKSGVKEMGEAQIIKNDFKDFGLKQGKFGIGQVEMVDLSDIYSRESVLLAEMDRLRESGGYHSVILFFTDIINEGSRFLVSSSDQVKVEEALGAKLADRKTYIPGIISRKKQVVPMFSKIFD